ncbi:MAG: hypothetical protein IKG47_04235 [Oscillospiraceae bacterium]|nr:hypothetical protein [Oscillospiraceae bacterium]
MHEYKRWAKETLSRFRYPIQVQFATETRSLPHPAKLIIDLDGMDSYTSKTDWTVHLGGAKIAEMYKNYILAEPGEEASRLLFVAVFTMRHEICHLRYTGGKSYAWGITRGTEAVCEEISRIVYGAPWKFRRASDLEHFRRELQSEKIYIPEGAIEQIVAGIMNSICDGRIERIMSSVSKGFAKDRFICRGEFWKKGALDLPEEYDDCDVLLNDPAAHLMVMTNQILTLSKCQAFQKGFTMKYAGTELVDELNLMLPDILYGYMGRSTRQVAEATERIVRRIAPVIFDAVRMSERDAEIAEQLSIFLQMLARMTANEDYGLTDSNAEEDEKGELNSALPFSSLVMEPEEGSESQNDCRSLAGGKSQEDDQPAGEGGTADSSVSDSGDFADTTDFENDKPRKSSSDCDISEDEIIKAMEEAAKQASAITQETINAVNQAAILINSEIAETEEIMDEDEVISPEAVADICDDFEEVKRMYEVTEPLPEDLLQRGKIMRSENEKRFREKLTKNKKHKRYGNIDVRALGRLAKNRLDIFETKGIPQSADCAAYVLIDNSGSMSWGGKREAACMAAAVVEEGFKGLMPLKIAAYDSGSKVIHEVVKGWNECLHNNCCYNFMLKGRDGWGNDDNYDIQIAARELLKRPEKKKLLVVLSDGAPSNVEATRIAIQNARDSGIQVIGIYFEAGKIGEDAEDFRKMYQRDYVCCTTEEIDAELSTILENFAHR